MSKVERLSGRSSFATVCDAAHRAGYRLKMSREGRVCVFRGMRPATVLPTDEVADWLQEQVFQTKEASHD